MLLQKLIPAKFAKKTEQVILMFRLLPFSTLKINCIEILQIGTEYDSCRPNLPAKWPMILIKNHIWGAKKQNLMCNPSSWYHFLVWPSVFRTFYRIERYQIHMITMTARMKQFCKFYCMLYSIIDTSCPYQWFEKKWLAHKNSYCLTKYQIRHKVSYLKVYTQRLPCV